MKLLLDHEIRLLKKLQKTYHSIGGYILFEIDIDLSTEPEELDKYELSFKDISDLMPCDQVMIRAVSDDYIATVVFDEMDKSKADQFLSALDSKAPGLEIDFKEWAANTWGHISVACSDEDTLWFGKTEGLSEDRLNVVLADHSKYDPSNPNLNIADDSVSLYAEVVIKKLFKFLKDRDYKMCESGLTRKYSSIKGVPTPKTYTYMSRSATSVKSMMSRDPNWSHCWKVMGHYRKHTGIGKNRQGERCIPGKTWVKEHYKQTQLDYVDKVRIVR